MKLLTRLWTDDRAFVISSELVLLGTLGVIGSTVGLHTAATALNEELVEVGCAFRSLDQSYRLPGFAYCGAMTAGSAYEQPDVEISLAELRALEDRDEAGRDEPRGERGARPPERDRPRRLEERRRDGSRERRDERRPDERSERREDDRRDPPRRPRSPNLDGGPRRL
ncbi:MAG: hypothetical protein WED34_04660 [Planctomycetales bacterium]